MVRQVHSHRVAAKCEKERLAQAQDAGIAPDKIKPHRHNRKRHVPTEHVYRPKGNQPHVVQGWNDINPIKNSPHGT